MFDTKEALLNGIRLGEDARGLGQQRSQTRMIRFDEQPVSRPPWMRLILLFTIDSEPRARRMKGNLFSRSSGLPPKTLTGFFTLP